MLRHFSCVLRTKLGRQCACVLRHFSCVLRTTLGRQCACVLRHFSCVRLFVTPGTTACQLLCPWDSPDKNTGVGCHSLLQGIFLTQGSKLGLLCFLPWQAGSLSPAPPGKPKDSWRNMKREEVPGVVMYTMGGCQG